MLAISVVLPVKAPMSFIVFITAVSVTAVSSGYLWGRPLPHFSGSCGLALGDDWGLAGEGTSLADLIDPYSLIKSCGSNR